MRVFRNTTCTPTAPPPQQNSHICAHAPGQAVKLTNSTGCSNLTGTGFPYPQSTPTRRLPLPTHLSPPLPAQNSHICTHARTRSSGQTNKQQRLLYTPGRPRLGSQVQAAPNLLAGQGRVHRRGCAPVATTSTRQRRTIASAHRTSRAPVRHSDPQTAQTTGCPYAPGRPRPGHRQWCTGGGAHLSPPLPPASAELSHLHIAHRAHRSGIQTHKQHRLQAAPTLLAGQGRVTGSGAQAGVRTCRHHFRPPPPQSCRICTSRAPVRRSDPKAQAAPTLVAGQGRVTGTGFPYAGWPPPPPHTHRLPQRTLPIYMYGPGTAGFCCLSAPMFLPAHCTHHLQSQNLSNVGFGSYDFCQDPFL